MRRIAIPLAALLALTACTGAPAPGERSPTVYPTRSRATAPAPGEVDCRAIQTAGVDSPAFGLLLLALEGSPDADVAAAAHDVTVVHVGTFDDPATTLPLVEIPLATLRIRCQLAYPGI